MKIEVYGESRKGKDHKENEDSYLIDKTKSLFAVADGVTIPYGGKEASRRAIRYLKEVFSGNIEKAFEKVNEKILEDKNKNPSIGYTTLIAAYIKENKIEIASVGDSVAYLINHEIELLLSSPNYFIGHPKILVDVWKHKLRYDEFILLCTDGVSNILNIDEITKIVKGKESLMIKVKKLLDLAEQKPSFYNDDKTVVLLKIA